MVKLFEFDYEDADKIGKTLEKAIDYLKLHKDINKIEKIPDIIEEGLRNYIIDVIDVGSTNRLKLAEFSDEGITYSIGGDNKVTINVGGLDLIYREYVRNSNYLSRIVLALFSDDRITFTIAWFIDLPFNAHLKLYRIIGKV